VPTIATSQKLPPNYKRKHFVLYTKQYNDHIVPIFEQLKILPYKKLIEQAKLKKMHSGKYKYAPPPHFTIYGLKN
jgi:uncharacterized protein with NAD-binding domain and iron-sulfur cluster